MRILIYSHPAYGGTGFATIVRNLVKHFKKDHEVAIVAIAGHAGNRTEVEGITILSCPGLVQTSAQWARKWAIEWEADLVIQHFDIWMLPEGWITEMPCPVITYAPVDCTPLPNNFKESCEGAAMNVAMSIHAHTLMKKAGMPSVYIPHGVDTEIYKPLEGVRENTPFKANDFIVGIVATNGSIRKNLGGQIQAFKKFAEGKDDVHLHMHTQCKKAIQEGIQLEELATKLDISDKVSFADPEAYALGIDESYMPLIYNMFDVLLQCSLGEGFGLPIIEAQACGTPVIGTQCSAISENIGPNGREVNGTKLFMPYYLSNVTIPKEGIILDALNSIYHNKKAGHIQTKQIVEFGRKFSWDKIFPLWDKLLTSIKITR
jgi:glycosyltransferase involved in cell wall biosynthesis